MKRIISIAISFAILVLIYWRIDFGKLIEVLKNSDIIWLVVAISILIPLTMLTSWRLQQLVPAEKVIGFGEANRLVLAASGLNVILPSKMGDIAKAYFMQKQGYMKGSLALSMVIFEKTCDMLSLLMWCVFGLILYTQKDWLFWTLTSMVALGLISGFVLLGSERFAKLFFTTIQKIAPSKIKDKVERLQISWLEMHAYFWQDKVHLAQIFLLSLFIWFLNLFQIWLFILALKAWVPLLINLALAPLSILIGLLPLTFAGVGTRDAAVIAFYHPFLTAPIAAALGILFTLRYLILALGGLLFLRRYLDFETPQ